MVSGISSVYSIAASGLNSASNRLAATAGDIANAGTDNLVQDSVDLSSEKISFKANALVLKSADQMLGTLLDVLDTPRRS